MPLDGGLRERLRVGMGLNSPVSREQIPCGGCRREGWQEALSNRGRRILASRSAAGSVVMNGTACNGWPSWSLAKPGDVSFPRAAEPGLTDEAPSAAVPAKTRNPGKRRVG